MHKRIFILGTILVFLLVACSPAGDISLPDEVGQDINLQTSPTPLPTDTPGVVTAPNFDDLRASLAEELGESIDSIEVKSVQARQFRNSCLGLEKSGEMCLQVITPGFRVVIETPEGTYIFHTDQSGAGFRMAQSPEGVQPQTAILWERSGGIAGICQRLMIYPSGAYLLEDCNSEQTIGKGKIPPAEWENLQSLIDRYGAFEWTFQPPEGSADMFIDSYSISGEGENIPSDKVQESINQMLAELASQLNKLQDPGAADK